MNRLVIVTYLVLPLALAGCDLMSHTRCNDKMLARLSSSDRKYTAILYHRSCANDTAKYTWVNLEEVGQGIFSKSETQPVLTIEGFHEINATWTGPETIEIKCRRLADQKAILTQKTVWKGIHILYKNE